MQICGAIHSQLNSHEDVPSSVNEFVKKKIDRRINAVADTRGVRNTNEMKNGKIGKGRGEGELVLPISRYICISVAGRACSATFHLRLRAAHENVQSTSSENSDSLSSTSSVEEGK